VNESSAAIAPLTNGSGEGTPIEAACRIVILEDQLEGAQRINAEHRRAAGSSNPTGR
jgi:hypothetical protein